MFKRSYYMMFNYEILNKVKIILSFKGVQKGKRPKRFNNVIITVDTETSKLEKNTVKIEEKTVNGKKTITKTTYPVINYVVFWTLSIVINDENEFTLWGRRPSELVEVMTNIHKMLKGDYTEFWFHNAPYDMQFLRTFFMKAWGVPERQLNIRSHYCICWEYNNGIIIKDSYILSAKGLGKWAEDLGLPLQKTHDWEYNILRSQTSPITEDELNYACIDTEALALCIKETIKGLKKLDLTQLPYTNTGIIREISDDIAMKNKYHEKALEIAPTFEQLLLLKDSFHGGFTHASRHIINTLQTAYKKDEYGNIIYTINEDGTKTPVIDEDDVIKCFDFSSSYPGVLLENMYANSAWKEVKTTIPEIMEKCNKLAFVGVFLFTNIRLKDKNDPMPFLQLSKCYKISNNNLIDNGKILHSDMVVIPLNDVDLKIVMMQYDFDIEMSGVLRCISATKGYLPKWFRDLIYDLYKQKCEIKTWTVLDKVAESLIKAKINACYGMLTECRSLKNEIIEAVNGEWYEDKPMLADGKVDKKALFAKYKENYETMINGRKYWRNFSWGCYCTSYAALALFELRNLAFPDKLNHFYTDTDSVYGKINEEGLNGIEKYNEKVRTKLLNSGYEPIVINGRTFIPGAAELDSKCGAYDGYIEFKTQGAKRYAVKKPEYIDKNGEYHEPSYKITVAGVPKKAVKALKSLDDFKPGFVFEGSISGKLQHVNVYNNEILECVAFDDTVCEYADYTDLQECDYLLDKTHEISENNYRTSSIFCDEIMIQVYEE